MRIALLILPGLFVSFVEAPYLHGDEPGADAGALVRRLGDVDFRVRETAHRELARRGLAALGALERGAENADLETRRRCRALLAELSALANRTATDEQLAPFLAGDDSGKWPGWAAVRKALGADGSSRRLYARLYKSDYAFLRTLENDPKALCGQIHQRMLQKYDHVGIHKKVLASEDDVARVLLIATANEFKIDPTTWHALTIYLSRPDVHSAITWSGAATRLVGQWIELRCADPIFDLRTLQVARLYGKGAVVDALIDQRFRPSVTKMMDAAVADPGNFALAHQTLAEARKYRMADLINDGRLRAAILEGTRRTCAGPDDFAQLTRFVRLAKDVGGMEADLEKIVRPLLTHFAGKFAGHIVDGDRFSALVEIARASQCEDLLDGMLIPALRARLRNLTADERQRHLAAAFRQAKALGLEEEVESILRPAARALVNGLAESRADAACLQNALSVAQEFQLKKELAPVAQKLVDDAAQGPPDVLRLHALLQIVRFAELPNDKVNLKLQSVAAKSLVGLENQPLNDATVGSALNVADQFRLKDAVPLCLKACALESLSGSTRGQAVYFIARYGDRTAIPLLETLLDDRAEVGTTGIVAGAVHTQVCDVALGALVRHTGQNLLDYKFPVPAANSSSPRFVDLLAHPTYYGFITDAERQAAKKMWHDSRAKTK